jgi:hypothetical protein
MQREQTDLANGKAGRFNERGIANTAIGGEESEK